MADMAGILWILFIGIVAGSIARLVLPGPNRPRGFIVSTALGVAGAILATIIGGAAGIYHPHQFAGFVGSAVGSIFILYIWHHLVARGIMRDHGL